MLRCAAFPLINSRIISMIWICKPPNIFTLQTFDGWGQYSNHSTLGDTHPPVSSFSHSSRAPKDHTNTRILQNQISGICPRFGLRTRMSDPFVSTILYCTIPYYTILYCNIQYHDSPYGWLSKLPFWVPEILGSAFIRTQKGTIILATTHIIGI